MGDGTDENTTQRDVSPPAGEAAEDTSRESNGLSRPENTAKTIAAAESSVRSTPSGETLRFARPSGGTEAPTADGPRDVAGYEILEELGRGGMGVVYKARQNALKRVVALKMILAGGHAGADQLARFRAEAEAAARLQHPSIVQVYDIGEQNGRPFFSMEFVDGPSLAQSLARELPAPRQAAALVARLADALEFAHRQRVVHRDLKPANVLLADDGPGNDPGRSRTADPGGPTPKVTDFGLAKQLGQESGLTQTGAVMGTPSYMAPEQAAGDPAAVGPAADVYALGAILYECLTGRPPFRAPSLADTLDQVRRADPVPPSRLLAAVPRDLEVITLKCLHKEPARRYPSAEALADDLRRYLAGQPILARPVGLAGWAWRWCRRNPAVASLLGVVAVVFAAGAVGTAVNAAAARARARDALDAKAQADRSAAEAIESRNRAEEAARAATAATARTALALGNRVAETGDPFGALIWYAEAWSKDRGAGVPESTHRTRFGGILGQLPVVLRACFFHPEPVLDVRWHPTGRWLATRTDGGLCLWNVSDPTADPVRVGPPGPLNHFELSPDGGSLAACGDDGNCGLWSVPDGKPLGAPLHHPGAVLWVAFHPSRPQVATAAVDGVVRFWDLTTGKAAGAPIEAAGPASFVTFDRSGRRVLVATENDRAAVFDVATGKAVCPPVPHRRRQLRVRGERFGSSVEPCFSPDGETFAGGWNGPYVRRTQGGEVVDQIDYGENTVRRLEFAPDGKRVLVQAKALARWWKPGATPAAEDGLDHPRESWVGAVSPDGSRLATASTAGKVHLWDAESRKELFPPLQHAGDVHALRFSPDGSSLAAVGDDGTARVWTVGNPGLAEAPRPGEPDSFPLAFWSPDRTHTRRASRDGRFRMDFHPKSATADVVRQDTGEKLFEARAPGPVTDSGFTPDGRVAYLVGEWGMQLWDVEARRCAVKSVQLKGAIVAVASARDAGRVLVVDSVQFEVYDLSTGERVFGPVEQVANDPAEWGPADATGYGMMRGDISPDGSRVVMPGGSYRVLRSYDLTSAKAFDVALHDGFVYRAMFSADGRRVLSAGSDGSARLWDPATGTPLGPALWHPTFVRDAALAADGRTAVSYSGGYVRVWDAEAGDLILPPLLVPERPSTARVYTSADGRRILAKYREGNTNRIIRWPVRELDVAHGDAARLAELLTGRRVDAGGGLAPLQDEEVRRDRDAYRRAFMAYHAARDPLPPLPVPTDPEQRHQRR